MLTLNLHHPKNSILWVMQNWKIQVWKPLYLSNAALENLPCAHMHVMSAFLVQSHRVFLPPCWEGCYCHQFAGFHLLNYQERTFSAVLGGLKKCNSRYCWQWPTAIAMTTRMNKEMKRLVSMRLRAWEVRQARRAYIYSANHSLGQKHLVPEAHMHAFR